MNKYFVPRLSRHRLVFLVFPLILTFQPQNELKDIFPKKYGSRESNSLQTDIFGITLSAFLQVIKIFSFYVRLLVKRERDKFCLFRCYGYYEKAYVERKGRSNLKKNT